MKSRKRSIAAASILVAMAMTVAPQALAGSDRTVKSDSDTLAPESGSLVFAECDRGSHATGAGFKRESASEFDFSANLRTIYPREGIRSWFAGFDNQSLEERTGKTYVVCHRGPKLPFETEEYVVDESAGTSVTLDAKCPRGSVAAAGGALLGGPYNAGLLLGLRPATKRTWKAAVTTNTDDEFTVITYVACDSKNRYEVVEKTVQADSFPRVRRTNFDTIKATARCPEGSATTSGGWELDESTSYATILGSYPRGARKWTSIVRYGGRTDPKATSYAVCRKG